MEEQNSCNSSKPAQMILAGSIASAVSLVVIMLILLLLIFYKTYTSTLQRLLLYLTIVTVIQEASMTLGYAAQFEYNDQETFNIITSVTTWSATVVYLSTIGIFIYLPFKFYKQIRGDPFPRQLRSKCCRVALECLFIFVVLVLPLTYVWTFDNCNFLVPWQSGSVITNFPGPYMSMNSFNAYDLVGLIEVMITIGLSVVFCCLACNYRQTRQPFLTTLCQTLILLGLFVASTLLFNIGLRLSVTETIYALVNAGAQPVVQLIFPTAFLFYLYSFTLFRWRAIKRAAAEWKCFRSCCNAPRVGQIQEAATAPGSHHVTAPSVTFFDVPHTGAFTDLTTDREEQQALLPDGDGDTGYGGVVNAV